MNTQTEMSIGNDLLSAFQPDVLCQFKSKLKVVQLKAGDQLFQSGDMLDFAYFPVTAVVSLFSPLEDGRGSEVAVVGCEGVVGIAIFMGAGGAMASAVVQRSGLAFRVAACDIKELAHNEQALHVLLAYAQVLFSAMAQTSTCHSNHTILQQLSSWLLQHLDRQNDDDLYITQERISGLLSVRRETTTECALQLASDGAIRYQRGLIQLLDKEKLKKESCECYEVNRNSFEKLKVGLHPYTRQSNYRLDETKNPGGVMKDDSGSMGGKHSNLNP